MKCNRSVCINEIKPTVLNIEFFKIFVLSCSVPNIVHEGRGGGISM